jgi:hypothetical protein
MKYTIMATKRAFVSDLELQDTLSKLQKTNEESVELIGQLGTQVGVLVKEVTEFQQSLVDPITPIVVPIEQPITPVVPIDPLPLEPVVPLVEPVIPNPTPVPVEEGTTPIVEPVLPSPLEPVTVLPIDSSQVEVVTDAKPEITYPNLSNLVISSWLHGKDGFAPWSHKLMWEGKRYKSCSIYYFYGNDSEINWNNIDCWEYLDFDYGDSDLLSHSISFLGRSRSNNLNGPYGFTPQETGNGGERYWTIDYNHNA